MTYVICNPAGVISITKLISFPVQDFIDFMNFMDFMLLSFQFLVYYAWLCTGLHTGVVMAIIMHNTTTNTSDSKTNTETMN